MFFFLFTVGILIAVVLLVNDYISHYRFGPVKTDYDYDAIVVGGSIAGPVVAKALSDQGRKVLVVERSLFTKPDRIVGELLQPGGIDALKEVGMEECATSIGMPCQGYLVVDRDGKKVDLPYRAGASGVSFHFGDFVQKLRAFVFNHCKENVTMLEGTVTKVLTSGPSCFERAYGIEYTMQQNYAVPPNTFEVDPPKGFASGPTVTKTATAPLIIMCDGGMSKWKGRYQHYTPASDYHSNFVGLIVKRARLPTEQRGTVFFGKTGPILSYRLDDNELRMLVDYNKPSLPSLQEQSAWLVNDIAPCLPKDMQEDFLAAARDVKNLKSMPVARYPPTFSAIKGYVGIGDHNNQRHPLTGGGMTCAFWDAIRIARNLKPIKKLRVEREAEMTSVLDWIQDAVVQYSRYRYAHSCCINLLSWALYAVFSTPQLRDACFDYFVHGGDCVTGPMDLLAGLDPSVFTLVFHYYRVMIYGVGSIMTKSGAYSSNAKEPTSAADKTKNMVSFFTDMERIKAAGYLLVKSTAVAVPLVKNEFFSMWRLVDPTSVVAVVSKKIKTIMYSSCYNGKQRKPVGI
ncbi:squalene monooxygenase [Strigomonas culicis]|uniref:Squalene monooxygenase n=1 Tax=Strigomonas culicis TaxID=28005 RepID=S9U313_9TRYP|nr:squalene monooxygenase [Strigomonas culicis]EPY35248.1 squalene monooxygenase [Strigomonas culicis]|eukprot:EPY25177.1 squalene monooxygenase [Strigomonas culicis]